MTLNILSPSMWGFLTLTNLKTKKRERFSNLEVEVRVALSHIIPRPECRIKLMTRKPTRIISFSEASCNKSMHVQNVKFILKIIYPFHLIPISNNLCKELLSLT